MWKQSYNGLKGSILLLGSWVTWNAWSVPIQSNTAQHIDNVDFKTVHHYNPRIILTLKLA